MGDNNISDGSLLKRIKEGDQKAFEIFFRRYYSRLNEYAFRYLQDIDLANDAVQEVFIAFWKMRATIHSFSLEHLMFRMVRNYCFNYFRNLRVIENKKVHFKNEKMKEELLNNMFPSDIPISIYEEELEKELEDFLSVLPEKCQRVFLLSRKEGLSNSDIAEKMNFSIKNVEKYISMALREFRIWLKKRNSI